MTNLPLAAEPATLGDLADPAAHLEPLDVAGWPADQLRGFLERMHLVRAAERAIAALVERGAVKCPCHLVVGQEACAIGVTDAIDGTRDRAFGAHRSHGHYLGVGGDLDALMAEVLGKATGCSGGMGGSMHLVAADRGLYGTVPIVGATIPIAVGAGLAAKMDGAGGVAVTFFGDGATEEGVFHESMNLAMVNRLPVLFACENNLFSSHLHIALRQPDGCTARYAEAHRMPFAVVDGNDVLAVARATREAFARMRAGDGPFYLEMVTYRWYGHVGPRDDIDVGVARDGDLPSWKRRDPIARLAAGMRAAGLLAEGEAEAIAEAAEVRVARAVAHAEAAPYPDDAATTRWMYTGAPR